MTFFIELPKKPSARLVLKNQDRGIASTNPMLRRQPMMQRRTLALTLLLPLLLLASQAAAAVKTLTLADVEAMVAQKPAEGHYMLIDARPEIKYFGSHLPHAVSLPWMEMKERLDELPEDKATALVFYCGGLKCDLSAKAAALVEKMGYTDVSIFPEGEPGWRKEGNSPWVATSHIKMILNDRDRIALVVDARPFIKYNAGTIPGALNIPFQEWDKLKGLLPADKDTQLIFFCGGLKCNLSHKSAAAARAMGYTDVRTYAEGWPAWKKNSTRAFAMVNPKQEGQAAPAEAEAMVYEGEIGKEEFLKLVAEKPEGLLLIDVRPADEFEKAHIPGAINILDEKIEEHI
ncbi:MAG: sulfurtransferase [Desulfuromonas sp.]|nr:MAG: sulfurtransferase [Desulfuromonas sp.]